MKRQRRFIRSGAEWMRNSEKDFLHFQSERHAQGKLIHGTAGEFSMSA